MKSLGIFLVRGPSDFDASAWAAFTAKVHDPLASLLYGSSAERSATASARLAAAPGLLVEFLEWDMGVYAVLQHTIRDAAISELGVEDPVTVVVLREIGG
ncbi:MAG: hypothetical protein H6737_23895 [Alphaproteobacteria bacterium]|nr:hypothetical protein [Alphaproteobacteria bacterium]